MAAQRPHSFSIWQQLPPELGERIVSFLAPSEVACTVRLINKAAAMQFRGPRYTTVRLSLPSPTHAFRQRWGSPGAMRGFTLEQRQQLVCLTARSGSIPNLGVAAANVGFNLHGNIFIRHTIKTDVSGRREGTCQWLRVQGCSFQYALHQAARAGQRAVCEWLLSNGCGWDIHAVYGAARGGHSDLMDWLLQRRPEDAARPNPSKLLAAAAEGFDLPTLQRLAREWLGEQQPEEWQKITILKSAASSPTPDWQSKVEWLEAQEYPKLAYTCAAAVACPDALCRLAWLRQRGYPVDRGVAKAAMQAGRVDVLECLLAEGVRPDAFNGAARLGQLAALTLLHSHGYRFYSENVWSAAGGGQLPVVVWLVETLMGEVELQQVLTEAAWSGNVALPCCPGCVSVAATGML